MSTIDRVLILEHCCIKRLFKDIIHTQECKFVQILNLRRAVVKKRFIDFPGGNTFCLLEDEHHRICREMFTSMANNSLTSISICSLKTTLHSTKVAIVQLPISIR